jgi:hypothetical protein
MSSAVPLDPGASAVAKLLANDLKVRFDHGEIGVRLIRLARNDKLPETLAVRRAELCADECGTAVHIISPSLISLGEIK